MLLCYSVLISYYVYKKVIMYKISIEERMLHFRQPAGTSRGVYTERRIWLLTVSDGYAVGIGECAPLPDLSCDALPHNIYNNVLRRFCDEVEQTGTIPYEALRPYPSMLFGLETALLSLTSHLSTLNSKLSTLNSQPYLYPFRGPKLNPT